MKFKQLLLLFAISALIFSTISVNGNTNFTNKNDLELNTFPADNYADEIITEMSFFYTDGENALGAPDGEYAKIFADYTVGLVFFDLGRYEICVNETGDDLRVHINYGTYIIKIGNDLSSPFTTLGQSNTTKEFDIDSVGFTEVRYVQIQYFSDGFVELDAIEVINLYTVATDNVDPNITPVDDFWVYDNVSLISFSWDVSDATPWNYSIEVNGVIIKSDDWFDVSIAFLWTDITAQNLTITLLVFDFFGNSAEDIINVEIRPIPTKTTLYLVFLLPTAFYLYFKRRRNM